MKVNHPRQKCESPPICLPLSHNSFHIDHKVLPISLLSISKISPLFCILTAQDDIGFSFRSLESLLSLHPASFLSPSLLTFTFLPAE